MRLVELDDQIHILEPQADAQTVLRNIIETGIQEDAFYVLDVGDIVKKHKEWKIKMPRVEPFYAVKCNDSLIVLEVLAALGTGFDCASKGEINKVLSLGVDPSRILFANPAKLKSHIHHAANQGVDLMTFDNECELHKVKNFFPSARLILRIRCDSTISQCPLGMKFGCDPLTEAPHLLEVANSLGLNVVGISFHVGSGCQDPPVFERAITAARNLFDIGLHLGFNMNILDIGGGFPGNKGTSIDKIAEIVNSTLDLHFPPSEGINIIAEPGRFYAASAFTLATNIHSKRDSVNNSMYYINDGVYGSFNCILYDHAVVSPQPFMVNPKPVTKLQPASVWGPTCDGLDQVVDNCLLPPLDIGDWLIFEDMGAYTLPVASQFNGFPVPKVHAVIDEALW
ncbi:ornithine decarboxylase-like isoform X2 [Lycorma delicatula]